MDALSLAQLMELERKGWDSLTRSRGGDFYGQLMTPDAVMVLVNGMVLDRDTIESSLNESPPWASYELAEERLVEIGGDAAAVVYQATASRDGQTEPFVALMSSVYQVIDDEPRLALYQQTTVPH
jgi:hypothetical protein